MRTRSQAAEEAQATREESAGLSEQVNLMEEEVVHLEERMLAREQGVPTTYQEAMESEDNEHWEEAIARELRSLEQHQIAEVVPRPVGKPVLPVKYVFKVKGKKDGTIEKYKARVVTKGFRQAYGVNYRETFAPVARITTIRAVIETCVEDEWPIHQADIKTAFLNGELEEEVYIEAPEGTDTPEGHVWRLKRALYGLKQAPRVWYKRLSGYMEELGYVVSDADPCLFYRYGHDGDLETIILFYVDDILIAGASAQLVEEVKAQLKQEFDVEDLGPLNCYLGMGVEDLEGGGIKLTQSIYIDQILERFGIAYGNPVATPMVATNFPGVVDQPAEGSKEQEEMSRVPYRAAIGCLLYLAMCTRPDIALAVSKLARAVENPGYKHWTAVKRVMRYIKGTRNIGLIYNKGNGDSTNGNEVHGFADASFADADNGGRRSTTGYLFMRMGRIISWATYRQRAIARSSTEAEYMALSDAAQETIWLRRLYMELRRRISGPTNIYEDNQGAQALAEGEGMHARTKHIDVRYHELKQRIQDGFIALEHVSTQEQLADILTKPLGKSQFIYLRNKLGMQ